MTELFRSLPLRLSVVVTLVCLPMIGFQCWQEAGARLDQVHETETSLINLAKSLAQHAEDTIEIADTAVAGLVERLETDGTSPRVLVQINRKLEAQIARSTRYITIIVVGPDGNALASSIPTEGINFSNLGYFRHHHDDPDRGVFVGPPIKSRMSGRWIITVSRRLQSADGQFAGLVLASIELNFFVKHYASYDVGRDGSIGLVTTDGTLLARYPSNESFFGRNVSEAAVFKELRQRPYGSFENNGLVDGRRRLSGYRSSDKYNLVVVAAMSKAEALAAWRGAASIHILIALFLTGAIWLLGLRLIRQVRRSQVAEERISVSEAIYRSQAQRYRLGEERHQFVIDGMAEHAIYWLDVHGNVQSWSTGAYHLKGYHAQEIVGRHFSVFFTPEDEAAGLPHHILSVAAEQGRYTADGWRVKKNGQRFWANVLVKPVRDAAGSLIGFANITHDETTRKEAEERLRESEARYRLQAESLQEANERVRLATDSGGIGLWEWNVADGTMIWDSRMFLMLGIQQPHEAPTYALWQRYVHPEDVAAAEQAVQAALDGIRQYDCEFRVVWNDGTIHHIHATGKVTRNPAGNVVRMVGANWDVSYRHAEEEQRAIIIEAAPNGMMIVDESGIITLVNSQVERLFGYPRGALVGQSIELLVPDDVHVRHRALRSAFTHAQTEMGATPGRELSGRRQDGSLVTIEIMLSPVKTPGGRVTVVTLLDISEHRRKAHEQLQAERRQRAALEVANADLDRLSRHLARARDLAEQASRAKSRFLAAVSHELRTPLNGILGYAQLLRLDGDLNVTQAARVGAMLDAGKHLLEMITDVLDLSEIEAEHMELRPVRFDLRSVAQACLDLVRPTAEAKGLRLSMSVSSDTPREIVADPMRLRQVLLNLLGNAAKFTTDGSIALRLATAQNAAALRIDLVDTGPGIAVELRQHLFRDFARLDIGNTNVVEGAGLGLALAARLVGLMGGRLGYDDNPGGGSVFWLELPLDAPVTSVTAAAVAVDWRVAQPSAMPKRALLVLVADDMPMNRDITSSFLRAAGHEPVCVENGLEAVAAAQTRDFDIILMDIRMPHLDGLEATRRIRAVEGSRGRVPIVALTAQAFTDQVQQCHGAGMTSHLSKPFDMQTLLAAVAGAAAAMPATEKEPERGDEPECRFTGITTAVDAEPVAVLDPIAFRRTAGFLAPAVVAAAMRTITEQAESVLRELDQPDDPGPTRDALVDAAHTLAGSAGMFGFERVAAAGRCYEQAVQSGATDLPAVAERLRAAVEATLREIPDC